MTSAGQPNMQQILQQAHEMQQQLLAAQRELAAAEVTGQAGGGLVTVRASATGEVLSVTIHPTVVDPEDIDTLQDLIVGALRDASRGARQLQAEKMGGLAGLGDLTGGAGGLGLTGF